VGLIRRYLDWLRAGAPAGEVERYPEIDEHGETSLPGVFVAGDLTGIPLLKLAAESGATVIRRIAGDHRFQRQREEIGDDELEVAIVGAGPAGISAALECAALGLRYRLFEATRKLNTIAGFPRGKPIMLKPEDLSPTARLRLEDGTKESLLELLCRQVDTSGIRIEAGVRATRIFRDGPRLLVEAEDESWRALRVVLAVGKSGNTRKLGVPGEDAPHVFDTLYDPAEFVGQQVLVVGGGNSAVEASVALARAGAQVVHSYRRQEFSRAAEENVQALNELAAAGKIELLLGSTVRAIDSEAVQLLTPQGERAVNCHAVFTLIGREPAVELFRRSGIRLQGERGSGHWIQAVALVSFFAMLYFGKKGNTYDLFGAAAGLGERIGAYLLAPLALARQEGLLPPGSGLPATVLAAATAPFRFGERYGLHGYQVWLNPLAFLIGWISSLVFLVAGAASLLLLVRDARSWMHSRWKWIKYGYFLVVALLYFGIYLRSSYGSAAAWIAEPTRYYALLYSVTIVLFGLRRALVRRTRYIRRQMAALAFVQVWFLYLLPFQKIGDRYLFDILIGDHFSPNGWVMQQVFPAGRWTSFRFILFWPLTIEAFGDTNFWIVFPLVQLAVLFLLIRRYGKGVYCGWICSCGAMAESLGDEYRTRMPHGPRAKRWENLSQLVLVFAVGATAMHVLALRGVLSGPAAVTADAIWGLYLLLIDIVFAGVLGLGVYFFLSGRVWCRFGCPLAALMNVMNRFTRYRILSEKKKCISCNICTRVCHMGIDVMNYANKGIPMNDVECVRCSACIVSCPMDVLAFGELPGADPENRSRQALPSYDKDDWRAGLV
jgi:thioredoxin reductase/NAD-dependent dihydropyrimidine dehydrogenase PreA subunit